VEAAARHVFHQPATAHGLTKAACSTGLDQLVGKGHPAGPHQAVALRFPDWRPCTCELKGVSGTMHALRHSQRLRDCGWRTAPADSRAPGAECSSSQRVRLKIAVAVAAAGGLIRTPARQMATPGLPFIIVRPQHWLAPAPLVSSGHRGSSRTGGAPTAVPSAARGSPGSATAGMAVGAR
jgi:hypothetical protein